jgi:hypothetical protein
MLVFFKRFGKLVYVYNKSHDVFIYIKYDVDEFVSACLQAGD